MWLFDYRAGIDLPSADSQFTVDAIAYVNGPRALDQVRGVTGSDTVQVFAHWVRLVSLVMALLDVDNGCRPRLARRWAPGDG